MTLRLVAIVALVALPAAARGQVIQPPAAQEANPPQAAMPPKPSAVVRGHVYAADSGLPLRGAQVRIVSADNPGQRENRLAATDTNGAYEFTDLPAGRYNLTAMKGAYVTISYGQVRPFEPGRALDVADAQLVDRVDFPLPRGGVIAGRIVDEYGEPLSRVGVLALRTGGARQLEGGRPTTTDDLGEFRLFGLSPSDYIVQASAQLPTNAAMPNTVESHEGYATTFFPGVVEAGQAKRLTVGIGQIIEDVSFVMQTARMARVSGSVTDSKGRAFTGMLMVMRMSNGNMSGNGWPIRPDGTFVLSNMAPGQYTLEASRFDDDEPEAATMKITVAGEDIPDLHIVTAPYVSATGRIIADPALLQQSPIRGLSVTAIPASPEDMFPGPSRPGRVNDDLTFEVKTPPGKMRIRLMGLPTGVDIRAVRAGGIDVTDDGIDLRPGAPVRDVEVELTNRPTTVIGTATNARGEPARDYTTVLFSRDQNRWKAGSRYIKVGRPDQDARFKVTGLPPGDYYAIALESVESGRWYDEQFLDRIHRDATMFSLIEGETKAIDLKLQTVR
jgi:Carboxypeptidase regulatory-like domain